MQLKWVLVAGVALLGCSLSVGEGSVARSSLSSSSLRQKRQSARPPPSTRTRRRWREGDEDEEVGWEEEETSSQGNWEETTREGDWQGGSDLAEEEEEWRPRTSNPRRRKVRRYSGSGRGGRRRQTRRGSAKRVSRRGSSSAAMKSGLAKDCREGTLRQGRKPKMVCWSDDGGAWVDVSEDWCQRNEDELICSKFSQSKTTTTTTMGPKAKAAMGLAPSNALANFSSVSEARAKGAGIHFRSDGSVWLDPSVYPAGSRFVTSLPAGFTSIGEANMPGSWEEAVNLGPASILPPSSPLPARTFAFPSAKSFTTSTAGASPPTRIRSSFTARSSQGQVAIPAAGGRWVFVPDQPSSASQQLSGTRSFAFRSPSSPASASSFSSSALRLQGQGLSSSLARGYNRSPSLSHSFGAAASSMGTGEMGSLMRPSLAMGHLSSSVNSGLLGGMPTSFYPPMMTSSAADPISMAEYRHLVESSPSASHALLPHMMG